MLFHSFDKKVCNFISIVMLCVAAMCMNYPDFIITEIYELETNDLNEKLIAILTFMNKLLGLISFFIGVTLWMIASIDLVGLRKCFLTLFSLFFSAPLSYVLIVEFFSVPSLMKERGAAAGCAMFCFGLVGVIFGEKTPTTSTSKESEKDATESEAKKDD